MLLKQQFEPREVCRESEAFAATCVVFKIKIAELAMASGLDRRVIESFKSGDAAINSSSLLKIVKALTPSERSFYNALVEIQTAAHDAAVTLPLLDFNPIVRDNIFRDAIELTIKIFGIDHKTVYTAAGMQSSNFSAWFTGRRDISVTSLSRIKGALSREQRAFFESVCNIYISMEPFAPTARIIKPSQMFENINSAA